MYSAGCRTRGRGRAALPATQSTLPVGGAGFLFIVLLALRSLWLSTCTLPLYWSLLWRFCVSGCAFLSAHVSMWVEENRCRGTAGGLLREGARGTCKVSFCNGPFNLAIGSTMTKLLTLRRATRGMLIRGAVIFYLLLNRNQTFSSS